MARNLAPDNQWEEPERAAVSKTKLQIKDLDTPSGFVGFTGESPTDYLFEEDTTTWAGTYYRLSDDLNASNFAEGFEVASFIRLI